MLANWDCLWKRSQTRYNTKCLSDSIVVGCPTIAIEQSSRSGFMWIDMGCSHMFSPRHAQWRCSGVSSNHSEIWTKWPYYSPDLYFIPASSRTYPIVPSHAQTDEESWTQLRLQHTSLTSLLATADVYTDRSSIYSIKWSIQIQSSPKSLTSNPLSIQFLHYNQHHVFPR